MYAHEHNDSRIFELHREIACASQAILSVSVADFFGYLQSRWEELAQYEPLIEFPVETAALVAKRLNRHHTCQFLMVLKPEFESLRTQILNSSPMLSLYEVFPTIDGDERRCRLIQPPPIIVPELIPDQMAFATASGSLPCNRHICSHCGAPGHTKDRCFKLHLELQEKYSCSKGKTISRTAVVAKITPSYVAPDFTQPQSQISQLQTQLVFYLFHKTHTPVPPLP